VIAPSSPIASSHLDAIARAQCEQLLALGAGVSLPDQAAARRLLRGPDGGLAWTPAIEQRLRARCAKAWLAMMGRASEPASGTAPSTRTVDVCSACRSDVEQDADGPCCTGATIEQETVLSPSAALGLDPAVPTIQQVRAVRAALPDAHLASPSERLLRAACEILLGGYVSDATVAVLTVDEISEVAGMGPQGMRELVAQAYDSATPSLQVVRS
jgi:hypothetical protein